MPVITVKTEKQRETHEFVTPLSAEERRRLDKMIESGVAFDVATKAQVTTEQIDRLTEDITVAVKGPIPGG